MYFPCQVVRNSFFAFASVYAMNPQIYVLDEPSANLDIAAMEKLSERMKVIKGEGTYCNCGQNTVWHGSRNSQTELFI